MNTFFRIFLFSFTLLIFVRCSVTRHTPIVTFKDQTEKLHAVIEKTSAEQYAEKNYQSLSFGDLKVYKPEAFVQLDSMYSIKKAYMDNDDLRGLERSGLEDLIPGYRAAAQEKIHEVQYEIEHLFQTSNENNITIYHSYFLFDYQDSLISVTPFYNFQIPKKSKATYYAYQFDYHFVTNRDLYISKDELNFIQFFKQREVALIGDESLQPFMKHTMKVMEAARKVQTIDFRQIAKQLAVDDFKLIGQDIVIKKIGSLFAIEENEIVRGYELEIEWLDELTKYKITTFTFSPYLEIIDIKTKFK